MSSKSTKRSMKIESKEAKIQDANTSRSADKLLERIKGLHQEFALRKLKGKDMRGKTREKIILSAIFLLEIIALFHEKHGSPFKMNSP